MFYSNLLKYNVKKLFYYCATFTFMGNTSVCRSYFSILSVQADRVIFQHRIRKRLLNTRKGGEYFKNKPFLKIDDLLHENTKAKV